MDEVIGTSLVISIVAIMVFCAWMGSCNRTKWEYIQSGKAIYIDDVEYRCREATK